MSPAAVESPERAAKHDKKAKRDKKHRSEKKRARDDEDGVAETERRPKKARSVADEDADEDAQEPEINGGVEAVDGDDGVKHKKEKKKSKKKRREEDAEADTPESTKTKKKKSKKHEKHENLLETPSKPPRHDATSRDQEDGDAMDVDGEEPAQASSASVYQPPDIPVDPQFPFFTQTVSLYEPIYPRSWSQPVTSCQHQHLGHLRNRYVPSLRGVLLDYRNVTLNDRPGRTGAARTDEDATTLRSLNEFAVGFGWITADVDLFVPSRGAWMEGSVNLQTEGHIGVVCFGKFNASIEARRLPPRWRWVSNEDPAALGMEETASVITADDHGVTRQVHSTGFWVDGDGEGEGGNKVKGRIRFRIRNFDVGISGDTSYLSLEGTMLDRDAEKKLVREEAALAEQRKGGKGGRGVVQRRRAPEFAMTRFADEEAEEQPVTATSGEHKSGI